MEKLNENNLSREALLQLLRNYELYYYFFDKIQDYNKRKDELLALKSVDIETLNRWFKCNYPDDTHTKIYHLDRKSVKIKICNLLDGMMMISIPRIDRDSINYCISAIKELYPHTIVLDLRDCTGGDVDSAIDFAARFIKKCEICHNSFRNKDYRYYAKNPDISVESMIILVNGNTISSAEILATTFYINMENCTVIGSKTFGKNMGQTVVKINEKSKYIFSMTAFKWDVSGFDSSIFSNIGKKCRTVLCKSDCIDEYLSCVYAAFLKSSKNHQN